MGLVLGVLAAWQCWLTLRMVPDLQTAYATPGSVTGGMVTKPASTLGVGVGLVGAML